jgi:Nucleotidyltransferase domain
MVAEHLAGPADALAYARHAAAICRRGLAGRVSAVILHGSLVLDDYSPGRSDIDLLAVSEDELTDQQARELVGALVRTSPPAPVDVRVITRAVASSPPAVPPMELYVRLNPRKGTTTFERPHPGEVDLLVELSICRARGRSLAGPAPGG